MRVSEMTPIVLAVTASAALLVLFFGMRYIIQPLRALEQALVKRAFLYDQPVGYRAGIQSAFAALRAALTVPVSVDKRRKHAV
jgi:hypothetical protein